METQKGEEEETRKGEEEGEGQEGIRVTVVVVVLQSPLQSPATSRITPSLPSSPATMGDDGGSGDGGSGDVGDGVGECETLGYDLL